MSNVYFQFYAEMYTQAAESVYFYVYIYIQRWKMFKFSLVGVLTARGFHVKGHSLISENMSARVPRNSLYNFTAVCRRR